MDDLRPRITALPIKAEQVGTAKWRVLAIPFGGPFKGNKDADGEFFSPRTDIKASWFTERPVLWHHGMDVTMKDEEADETDAIGTEGDMSKERDGWWAEMWLDRSNRYWQQVSRMLAAGKVYGSSGALGHVVRKDHKSGEILVWPHIEQTLTPTPANPFSRVVPVKALAHFSTAGIAVDDAVRGLLTEPDVPDLGPDLPTGGEDPAMGRLRDQLDRLEEALSRLR